MPECSGRTSLIFCLALAMLPLLVSAGLVGCAQAPDATPSGFLNDYSQLRPVKEYPGAQLYRNPSMGPDDYDKFILEPVIAYFAPNATGTAIDPRKVEVLTTYFHDQIAKALSEKRQRAQAPGPRVLRIRVAITDIKPRVHTWDVRPADAPTYPGGANVEIEAVDSQSGEIVLAVMDSLKGQVTTLDEREEFEDAKLALRRGAEHLRDLIQREWRE